VKKKVGNLPMHKDRAARADDLVHPSHNFVKILSKVLS